jgi:hypothetical protein
MQLFPLVFSSHVTSPEPGHVQAQEVPREHNLILGCQIHDMGFCIHDIMPNKFVTSSQKRI